MDISIIGNNSLKIKGKAVTFVVDPARDMPKTSSDAIILLNDSENTDVTRLTDFRTIINGPGGYEVAGAKISGTKTPSGTLYRLSIDGVDVILGKTIESKTEDVDDCQVAIINADNEFNESLVTAMEPKTVILYGDKKEDAAKKLGAENISPVPKVTLAKDKFPEKMEVVVLG